jgi:hypothetical protein
VSATWERAFVAMSMLVGESLEDALAALEGSDRVAALGRSFVVASREGRAQAMARALAEVALAVDAARLT